MRDVTPATTYDFSESMSTTSGTAAAARRGSRAI
jgi:hypothetical protein